MNAARLLAAVLFCLAMIAGASAAETATAAWTALTPAQKQVLAPLQREWNSIGDQRRAKWIEVANRFPALPPAERARLQERMAEWAHMTNAERGRARLQFQDARQVPQSERQDRWQAYQALPEVERRALAQRAQPTAKITSGRAAAASAPAIGTGKRNLVQTIPSSPRRGTSPTALQAKPGATTTPISARAQPPVHNQAGLPKIAATSGFVDPSTLLPQRGPQGAAVRTAKPPKAAKAASRPASSP